MPSAAKTSSWSSASSSAARHESMPVPTVTIRSTPAERAENSRRALREVRGDGDGNCAEPVGQLVENPIELLCPRLVLGQLPRLRLLDVAVEAAHEIPDRIKRARQIPIVKSPGQGPA